MHSNINTSAIYFLQGPKVGSQTRQANLHHSACSWGEPLATFPIREKNKYFNIPTGVVRQIASYLDTDSLLNLSSVNKKGSLIFSNEHFKDHFFKNICQRFPGLEKTFNDILNIKNVNYVIHSYPSNFWKVFCWVFSKPNCRKFPIPKSNIEYKNVLLNLQANWKMLIEKTLPEEMKKICGSGYADPNSEIHKAWILSENCKIKQIATFEERELFIKENSVVIDEITNIIDESDDVSLNFIDEFISEIYDKLELEVSKGKFDLELFLHGLKSSINKIFIDSMSKSVKGFVDLAEFKKELAKEGFSIRIKLLVLSKCISLYDNLESKRFCLNEEIKCISNINEVNKNIGVEEFEQIHKLKLIELKDLFVFNVIRCLEKELPENKELVRMLVNSTSIRTKIWKEIYDEYAGGIMEENWSENHFHKCSHLYLCIVEDAWLIKKRLARLDLNDNFKLMWLEKKGEILYLMKESYLKELNILGKLYDKCAKGKIEENWSENHFHEHLVELKSLITDECINKYNNKDPSDNNKALMNTLDMLFHMIVRLTKDLRYLLPN